MEEKEAIEFLKERMEVASDYLEIKEYSEALKIGIQALEKQIPKKPRKTDSYKSVFKRVYAYACPTCGNACLEKYMNERQNTMFCWNCGQRIDWTEESEEQ